MAMAIARNQPNHYIVGFNHKLVELNVSPTMRLDSAIAALRKHNWNGGSTDCAKTYEEALSRRLDVDKFEQFTALLDAPPQTNPGLERLMAVKAPWDTTPA